MPPGSRYCIRRIGYEGLGNLAQRLDFHQAWLVGSVVGGLMWTGAPRRRRIAVQAIAFHLGKSIPEARRIAKRSFAHTGRSFVEMFLTRKLDPRFVRFNLALKNPDSLLGLTSLNRPIVGVTGHFGAWELLAAILAVYFRNRTSQIIVKHPKDEAFAQMVTRFRKVGNNEIVSKDQAASRVLRCLRSNGISAFLVDHNTKRSQSMFLPFLGQTASVNIGPAVLALRTKALICPIFLLRAGRSQYVLDTHKHLDTRSLSGSMQEQVEAVARFYTKAVESMVQAYPEQWFWMHKRWRTRPIEEKHRAHQKLALS